MKLGCATVIVIQQSTKSRTTTNSSLITIYFGTWKNQLIIQTLMVSFCVIMRDESTHSSAGCGLARFFPQKNGTSFPKLRFKSGLCFAFISLADLIKCQSLSLSVEREDIGRCRVELNVDDLLTVVELNRDRLQ